MDFLAHKVLNYCLLTVWIIICGCVYGVWKQKTEISETKKYVTMKSENLGKVDLETCLNSY